MGSRSSNRPVKRESDLGETHWQKDALRTVAIAVANYGSSSTSAPELAWGLDGLYPVDMQPARSTLAKLLDEISAS